MNIKWEKGARVPVCRHEHTAVWLNGLVYVGGGYDASNPSYIINCYNPVKNSWSSSITTPYGLFAITALNNKLVTAGGQDKNGSRTNQILTIDGDKLKNCTKMTTVRSSAVAAGHQGMLIITGGVDNEGKKLSFTELFDSNNGQWYTCNDLPQPEHSLKSAIVDNILYLLGGTNKDGNYSTTIFTAPLDALSTHQLKWNIHQDFPWGLSTPVSVNGRHLLIAGGYKYTRGRYTYASDILKPNKASHSWEAIGHIPSPRISLAAVSTAGNRIIVIGGKNDKEYVTDTVWIGLCEPQ